MQLLQVEREEAYGPKGYKLIEPVEDIEVLADHNHIIDTIAGLARNALEAREAEHNFERKGVLKIWLTTDDRYAYIHFHNLQQIPPDVLPHIFERYFTTKEHGLGLGLDIYRRYMEANKGSLEIVSPVGKGTTATMKVPLYKP